VPDVEPPCMPVSAVSFHMPYLRTSVSVEVAA
jgi:hypothetical protein